jgi:hypothetical protein
MLCVDDHFSRVALQGQGTLNQRRNVGRGSLGKADSLEVARGAVVGPGWRDQPDE